MVAALGLGAVVLLELFEFLARLACRFTGGLPLAQAADDPAHLLLAIADRMLEGLAPLLLQLGRLVALLLPALQQLLVQQLGAGQQGRRLLGRLLLALALGLQAGDHLVEFPLAPGRQQLLGLVEHGALKAEAVGNREGIAAARDAPEQVVGGREGGDIEGHRGIFKAGIVVFERLELAEVGGGDREPGPLGQVAQQGDRQGRALGGIGAGAHLIEQHQAGARAGVARQSSQDPGDAAHVAAEGGEVLLQGLLIADVGQHQLAPGKGGGAAAGQKQAGAGHQGRQAHTFERDGFAAGVGAGDRHHPQLRAHLHAHRHHPMAALAAFLPEQQGMAQALQPDRGAGIRLQLGPHGAEGLAVAGPGQGEIQLHQHRLEVGEGRLLSADQATELQQHLLLLLPLLTGQPTNPVAQGDHGLGLDEHRAAGGGTVVDQAGQLGGGPGLHRQHGPAVALGHDRVLEQGAVATDQLLEALAPVGAGGGQLAAQLRQGGTGAIRHPAALLQAEAQPLLQLREGAQVRHQGRGHGPDRGVLDLAAQAPGRRQGGGHGQQGQA